ncbi:MAG TPA: NAD(P)/FAD-dependent oxidoreductase [Actinomycetota bacterium]
MDRVDVAVVGGGQAGLATSHELTERRVEHLVLERARVGEAWRRRWNSFCLVTPNWTVQLPGGVYDGPDPNGFLLREGIVTHLERYASRFDAPVREGVDVSGVATEDGGFRLRTDGGDLQARAVVLATGPYQRPHRPTGSATLPPDLLQIDVEGYSDPAALPEGTVLVVGSGQSGCQIAEELLEAGREVVLSCGRAPWGPRRVNGRDLFWWASESGFLDAPLSSLPSPEARLFANQLGTGHGGGHDLHLRVLRDRGASLVGHFQGADETAARFAPDLADSVAWGDSRYVMLREMLAKWAAEQGIDPPDLPDPRPFDPAAPESIELSRLAAVIFTAGFRPDYGPLVPWPGALDELGFPVHSEGQSSVVPGLFFVGVHFLRKRKSSLLLGVGEDAAIVAESIASASGGGSPSSS